MRCTQVTASGNVFRIFIGEWKSMIRVSPARKVRNSTAFAPWAATMSTVPRTFGANRFIASAEAWRSSDDGTPPPRSVMTPMTEMRPYCLISVSSTSLVRRSDEGVTVPRQTITNSEP